MVIACINRGRGTLLALACVTALVALLAAAVPAARADFGIASFTAATSEHDGSPATQAGAHPYEATVSFDVKRRAADGGPDGRIRDVRVDLPPGFAGDPLATPRCSRAQFAAVVGDDGSGRIPPDKKCPAASQVGRATIRAMLNFGGTFLVGTAPAAVWNLEPPPGKTAQFGFVVLTVPFTIDVNVDTAGDYHLVAGADRMSSGLIIAGTTITLWGVPNDPVHDAQRYCGNAYGGSDWGGPPCPVDEPRKPFLTNPPTCGAPQKATIAADSWDRPGVWASSSYDAPTVTGCERLAFAPALRARPTTRAAATPTGLAVDIDLPQSDDRSTGFAPPPLRDATVTLPEGVSINPVSADGLEACTDTQLGLGANDPVRCPLASKIGTVRAETPVLEQPLEGSVYLRSQASGDPASGQMFRLALVIENAERGLLIKLPGAVRVDPRSGRVTTTFADNPALPVSKISLALKAGARAPLVTPPSCGTVATHSVLRSWSPATPDAVGDDPMEIDEGCEAAGRFAPSLEAGVSNAAAGASSPFSLRLSRPSGQQELGSLNGSLPAGLLASLKSVPQCPVAQAQAGTCSAQSRVGKVAVSAGVGSEPLWLPFGGQGDQPVYLTAPLRAGDVAGMSIVVPAKAGPFDLGTVVTKVYLKLRSKDQGVDMQSEPLPRIVGGVPVQLRDVVVSVDRPGFMVNPTSCRAMSIDVNAFSQSWAKASLRSRFQVGGCASLPLSPVISVSGGGKGNTARFTHPSLKVTVRQAAGQAHLSQANVVLPKAFNVDLQAPSLKAACPREVYAQDECSPVATVGTVRAVTPLLAEPLTGPAFLLQKKGQLPDIVMRLRNSQMSMDLIGVLDFLNDSRVITRVKGIPDAALSSFELTIKGGKDGSLLNRSDLCSKKAVTQATFVGQNAKTSVKTPVTRIGGCPAAQSSRSRSRAANAGRTMAAGAAAAAGHARSNDRAAGGRS